MANILNLKKRIRTAQNVSKTTKAMQMIAASKLKKAQNAAIFSRPYVQKLTNLSNNLASKINEEEKHNYMKTNTLTDKTLTIVLSPDKGLSGGLLTNLTKELIKHDSSTKNVYITVGKKLEKVVVKLNGQILASFPFGTSQPSFDIVYPIINLSEKMFLEGEVCAVYVLYSEFTSVFNQTPKIIKLLPVEIKETERRNADTLFEPTVNELLPDLLKHYVEMLLYQNVLENFASEQGARMIAMKNATDNARDIISDLKLEYNKKRQEKITNEILDIGGASLSA
ncbi:ATP synthase F1 subunit gamma [Patescibacteria group bacterium]|nr:ATP synthase F1 subunit gamma [Patescibacteria group bacterium]